MAYCFSKILDLPFDEAINKVTDALAEEGFGIVTDFNVTNAFKNKLGIDFRPYRILGACNPPFAKQAIDAEDTIGTMLPCNVVVQQIDEGVKVTVVDPVASMIAVENYDILQIAKQIQEKLKRALETI